MLCEPTAKVLVENMATPEARVPVPIKVPPSLKETLPCGVPARLETPAENATLAPSGAGLGETLSTVVVVAGSTVTETGFDIPAMKSVSPANSAVNV
jgi:hypothetical protein